jgi:hypothetical protein
MTDEPGNHSNAVGSLAVTQVAVRGFRASPTRKLSRPEVPRPAVRHMLRQLAFAASLAPGAAIRGDSSAAVGRATCPTFRRWRAFGCSGNQRFFSGSRTGIGIALDLLLALQLQVIGRGLVLVALDRPHNLVWCHRRLEMRLLERRMGDRRR